MSWATAALAKSSSVEMESDASMMMMVFWLSLRIFEEPKTGEFCSVSLVGDFRMHKA